MSISITGEQNFLKIRNRDTEKRGTDGEAVEEANHDEYTSGDDADAGNLARGRQ